MTQDECQQKIIDDEIDPSLPGYLTVKWVDFDGPDLVQLDGTFSLKELEAIVTTMQEVKVKASIP